MRPLRTARHDHQNHARQPTSRRIIDPSFSMLQLDIDVLSPASAHFLPHCWSLSCRISWEGGGGLSITASGPAVFGGIGQLGRGE